jgi:hypothetical protein
MARPAKKTKVEGEVIFSIHGMDIRKNALYEIDAKYDAEAPDGFQEFSTTKLLNDQVVDIEPGARWNDAIKNWDTGLTANSELLKSVYPEASIRESVLKTIQDEIVIPYEELIGEGRLRGTNDNNDFWDNYRIRVGKGEVFNTANPQDLYQLFILLLKKVVTPKNHEKHPGWAKSAFTVIDKEEIISREEEIASRKVKCFGLFAELERVKGLSEVLEWLGVRAQDSGTGSVKMSVFTRFIENSDDNYKNSKDFVSTAERYLDEKSREVFTIHKRLKELYKLDKQGQYITNRRGEIYLDEEYIGNNFKVAAEKIYTDRGLKEKLLDAKF